MNDTQTEVEDSIEMAVAHGYEMNQHFTLVSVDGRYGLPDPGNKTCHPLETFILGQYIHDHLNVELVHMLGVTLQWIDGFVDGYADHKPSRFYKNLDLTDPYKDRYKAGFCVGYNVRQHVAMVDVA